MDWYPHFTEVWYLKLINRIWPRTDCKAVKSLPFTWSSALMALSYLRGRAGLGRGRRTRPRVVSFFSPATGAIEIPDQRSSETLFSSCEEEPMHECPLSIGGSIGPSDVNAASVSRREDIPESLVLMNIAGTWSGGRFSGCLASAWRSTKVFTGPDLCIFENLFCGLCGECLGRDFTGLKIECSLDSWQLFECLNS